MPGVNAPFYGVVRTDLVPPLYKREYRTRATVYGAMLRAVLKEFAGVGDFRRLKCHEIKYFYEGLRPELEGFINARK